MTERTLGLTRPAPKDTLAPVEPVSVLSANTQTALWPTRWPAIALQECIDLVEEQKDPLERARVKFELPCQDCEKNTACLNAKRKELGPLLYDREILTNPRSSESSLFPFEAWEPMLNRGMSLVPYWHKPFSLEHEYAVVQAWDIAFSEKIGGDYLVCETAYIHRPTGLRHMLDIERWQRLTFDEQIDLIEAKHRQFQADLVVIEDDAHQQVWAQRVRKTAVPVMRHGASGKQDFATGVPGLLILIQNRKWEFPYQRGTYHYEEIENMLATEFPAFGWNDGKLEGVGEHDDTVMCFWHLNWGLDRMLHWGQGGTEGHRGNVPGARQ